MTRTIFLQEFKRSILQAVLILFPFELGLIVIERIVLSSRLFSGGLLGGTPDVVVDILISALLEISAFVIGVGSFYRLTDRHVWFVHSLPVSRVQFWTLIVSANVGVVILTTPVVFLLRPSLWTRSDSWSLGNAWPYALGAYLVLFCAGCCFAMIFRNVATITIFGGAVIGISLGVTLLFSSMPNASPNSLRWYGILLSNRISPEFWLFSTLVLAFLYLGLSLYFFTKGEFRLLRTKAMNCALVVLLVVLYPLLSGAAIGAGFFNDRDYYYDRQWASVSGDGRFLAVFESERGNGFVTKIHFVDVATGAVSGTYESYALLAAWSKSKPVLNVVSLQSPVRRLGYLLPPSDAIIKISPEGRVLEHTRFGFAEILSLQEDRTGKLLVLTKVGRQAKLFSIGDGSQKELLATTLKDSAVIHPGSNEDVVAVYSAGVGPDAELNLDRAWSVGAEVRELTWAIESDDRTQADFLLDGKLHSRKAALAALKSKFPYEAGPLFYMFDHDSRRFEHWLTFSTSRNSCWGCVSSVPTINSISTKHVFAVSIDRKAGTGKFLKFDRNQSRWKGLGETLPLGLQLRTASHPLSQDEGIWNYRNSNSIGGASVIGDRLAIFYVMRGTELEMYLYDGESDKRFLLLSGPAKDVRSCYVPGRTRGIEGLILRCGNSAFIYTQENGLESAPLSRRYPLHIYSDRSHVFESQNGQVFYVSADGRERRLWPTP